MSTVQIRITIPEKLKAILSTQASSYGISVASYVRQLIMEEIRKRETFPVRQPSQSTIRAIKEGEKEFRRGKTQTLPLSDLPEFAKDL